MVTKRDENKDWLEIFRKGKELQRQMKEGETYANAEIKDIQKRINKR